MSEYYDLAQHIRDMYEVSKEDYFGVDKSTQRMYDKVNERVDEIARTIEKWGRRNNQDDHIPDYSDGKSTIEISRLLGELLGRYILMCDGDEDTSVYADTVDTATRYMKTLDNIADNVRDWLVDGDSMIRNSSRARLFDTVQAKFGI